MSDDFNPMTDYALLADEAQDTDEARAARQAQLIALLDRFDDLPFYPLCDPDMPLPGPDFVALALALGDSKPVIRGKKSAKVMESCGPILLSLYRAALYNRHFYLELKVKGRPRTARFVPGHCWGDAYPVAGPIAPAEVMVIGKCIGQYEHQVGRNFVGPSGEILKEALHSLGLVPADYEGWYISNLIRHENLDASRNQLAAAWVQNCAILQEQELRLVQPRFVLCLGAEASGHFLGSEAGGVSSSQGRVFTKRVKISRPGEELRWHTFQYMTCLHPAAVARTPDKKPEMLGTLRRFVALIRGELQEDSATERPDHQVLWTEEALRQTVDDLLAEHQASGQPSQAIALDCEWHGEFWSSCSRRLSGMLPDGKRHVPLDKGEPESWLRTVQFSHKPGYARTVVLRHGGPRHPAGADRVGLPAFVPGTAAAVAQLKRLFTSTPARHVRVVGHNLRADLPWLHTLDPELGALLIAGFEAPAAPELCREFGGFDTMYAVHAVQETAERKLEVVGMNLCGVRRYDGGVQQEKVELCEALAIGPTKLPGYGEITDQTLHPYGNWDVDTTIRIFHEMIRPNGLLDRDQYAQPSWTPFWLSQRKMTAELEMEMTGLLIDYRRAEKLTDVYQRAAKRLLHKLQTLIGWLPLDTERGGDGGFNPSSPQQVRTVLFGPQYSGKVNPDNGLTVDPRPEHAWQCVVLGLTPVKTSGKPSKSWAKVKARGQEDSFTASCDKESLGILLAQALATGHKQAAEILQTLRWCRFVNRVITGVLCPPDVVQGVQYDEDGDMIFEKGFMASVEWDRRVRTHFLPVETGRVASRKPNIQNLSKRREKDLKDILGSEYVCPLRAMITCPDDYFLVEADFTGAELMMMALQSGSKKMVDHCQRANLKETDPHHFDIHTNVAVEAFQLRITTAEQAEKFGLPLGARVPPRKSACEMLGRSDLRDIAKTIAFGIPYGRGDEAVVRAVEELGIKILPQDVAKIRGVIFGNYPELVTFFQSCQDCVLNPGHMATCFLRRRRFQDPGGMDDVLEELKRQAGNLPIQGGVADVTTIALHNLRHYPNRQRPDGTMRYRLVAQIHDAVMSEVHREDLTWYIDEVLPACMRDGVTIRACNLRGEPLPGYPDYHLGFDFGIYKHWGDKLSLEQAQALGIPQKFWPKPKK
jgi:uracil-DNA glycosylase family 4